MQYLILAVILAVMQASAPIPRKAPDSTTGTGRAVQRQSESKQTPAAQDSPSTYVEQAQDHKSHADKQGPEDAAHSIRVSELPPVTIDSPRRDWADWGTWGFTLLLAITSALQVWLLCRTTAFVRRQAHEAKRQRVTMGAQLKVMQGQLKKMEESLKVTEDSVRFAKKNLEVFINEKRARIFVELKPLNLDNPAFGDKYLVNYTVTCHGPTFAFVDESRAEAKVTDSPEAPDIPWLTVGINLPKTIPPEMEPKDGPLIIWEDIDDFVRSSIGRGKSFVHCRGIIKYKDFVGEQRETSFCYKWKPRVERPGIGGGYWEKNGPPEANRET